MALRDSVVNAVRRLFDVEREERDKADSPSNDAAKYSPASIYSVWGREDIGGLLSISQNLMDRFADYEAMLDYPDIRTAIRYFATDATQPNMDNGRTLWVTSRDSAIVGSANAMLRQRLRLEDDLFSLAFTLCTYGNDFEEILLTENGVVGLNTLPVPTMRRVERLNGDLIGYVQDITGRFTADQEELRQLLASSAQLPAHVAVFEDWQILHFRLRDAARRSPYGSCIPADGRVWTDNGPVSIADVKVGDKVFVRHCGLLRTTQVVDTFNNGVKPIFKLRTTHRSIRATANHPFLRWRGGKNNTWEQLGDLKVGDEIVVAAAQPATGAPPPLGLRTDYYDDATQVTLTERCVTAVEIAAKPRVCGGNRDVGFAPILRRLSYSKKQIDDIKAGRSSIKLCDLKTALTELGIAVFTGAFEVYQDPAENQVTLPDFVTPRFCRLLGFLLGDGWLTEHQVYFARGTDEDQNRFYETELASFGLQVGFTKDKSQCYVTSKRLVQAIRSAGWIDGAHEKRVPGWVFTLSPEIRREFLTGFTDADGWTSRQTGPTRTHVELCNRDLVLDLKTLIDGLGWTCGNVRERPARESKLRAGLMTYHGGKLIEVEQVIRGGPTYTITWHETPLGQDGFAVERIESIEADGEEEVFDIGVADSDHNFVCDGVVAHNSIAEGARWIWKRLSMLEDAVMIYRLTRAPARNVFYIDVTDVPPAKREAHLRRAKRELTKKSAVDPRTGRLDTRFSVLCLSGDTRIPLLNGAEKTLLEMVEAHERGEEQWVYSVDIKDQNKLKPGKVSWAGSTRKNAQLIKLTLDNGESIKVTPDHKMIRRCGAVAEAQTLKVGDSLMPFRRKRGDVSPAAPDYEMVYDPACWQFIFAHRVVAGALGILTGASDSVIHHRDCNRHNNDPRNLQEMSWADHKALHHKLSRAAAEKLAVYNRSPEKRLKTAEQNKQFNKAALMRAAMTPELCEKQREAARDSRLAHWQDSERSSLTKQRMSYVYSDEFIAAIRRLIESNPTAGAPTIARLAEESGLIALLKQCNPTMTDRLKRVHRDMLRSMAIGLGFESFESFKQLVPCDNHKVVQIEWLTEREDTYTLTVEPAHTFATSCGIMVCNSNDENYYVAVAEGRNLARVEVLAGPDYPSVVDIEYFQKKLHGSLMVPRAYLGQDGPIPGRAILSGEDIRAARVTLGVQKEMRNGFERLVRIDQAARGYPNPWQTEFEVCMTMPSGIYELAQLELRNARADFAARVEPYTSLQWIRENVFKMSDEEIAAIEKQREHEAQQAAEQAAKAAQGGPGAPMTVPGVIPGGGPSPALQMSAGAKFPAPPAFSGSPQEQRLKDNERRLEERRHELSQQNHRMLTDKIGALLEDNKALHNRIQQAVGLMSDIRQVALKQQNGHLSALPSAQRTLYPVAES